MKRPALLLALLSVFLLSTAAAGQPVYDKIDPALSLLTQRGADLTIARTRGIVKDAPSGQGPLVEIVLRFNGSLAGVEALGGMVRSVIGDIATVDVPLSAVGPLSQLSTIVFIEAAKRVKSRLDVSVPATNANILRTGTPPNWTGNTGTGVVVGVVDTGIDINHQDFKDVSGKTRVLFLWDQAATGGTPPAGYAYGAECPKAVIDAGGCAETDTDGHGSHVAGIAAGNGSASGNGKPAYRYIGMAPEADLIVANSLNPNVNSTTSVLDGVAYIQAKAASLGKPSVVNLSLGSHMGPHDGTSNYERALDNASGPGKVIVGAAGNEADANIHGSGTVAQGGTTAVGLTIPAGSVGESLDLWYAGADQVGISAGNAGNGACSTSTVNPGATQLFNTACGLIAISSSSVNPNNGDHEIRVDFQNGNSPLTAGAWTITLTGISVTNGRFDAWSGEDATNMQFTTNIDPSITLIDSGTAAKPISVASYNTKGSWTSLTGRYTYSPAITVGDISPFSSLGPRRACSLAANCPSIQKPDLAAPGMGVMSTYSAKTAVPDLSRIDPDGVHIIDQGTSMAAPHVTGAVALLLHAEPNMTSDQIKGLLTANAKTSDSYTHALPNNTWGYGKLDAAKAYSAVTSSSAPPAAPAGLSAVAGNGAATLSWTANTEPDLSGYNVYRSSTSGAGYVKVNASATISFNATSYVDSGLANGTTYYYVLTALNTSGQESAYSAQVSVTPIAPPDAGGGSSGSRCFIATAAFGSYLDPHVRTLRKFRDDVLLKTGAGKLFVRYYYAWSPPAAEIIAQSPALRAMTRAALTPLIFALEYPRSAVVCFMVIVLSLFALLKRRTRAAARASTR